MRKALINGEKMQIPEVTRLQDITEEGYYAVDGFDCPIVALLFSEFAMKYFYRTCDIFVSNGKKFSFIPTGIYTDLKTTGDKYCLIQVSETTSRTYAVKANTEEEADAAYEEIRRKVCSCEIELSIDDCEGTEVEIVEQNLSKDEVDQTGYEIYTIEEESEEDTNE